MFYWHIIYLTKKVLANNVFNSTPFRVGVGVCNVPNFQIPILSSYLLKSRPSLLREDMILAR